MVKGGWIIGDDQVPEHTHTKLENELEIDDQLVINSVNDTGKSWIRRDSNSTFILTDRDGDGSWDSPWPLKLDHVNNQGFIFDHEILTKDSQSIESGTFTPKILIGRGNTEPVYNEQLGFYSRIGSFCYISAALELSSHNFNFAILLIEGLPFSGNTSSFSLRMPLQLIESRSINTPQDSIITLRIGHSKNYCEVDFRNRDGSLDFANLLDIGQDFLLCFGGVYVV